jgi:4-hydroxy-tetrahydrodipicolinate synthase
MSLPPAEIFGVYTPLVTPRDAEQRPDGGALCELLDFAAEGGVRGVVIGGTTGEFVHLTPEERGQILAAAARHSRVPVLAGVGHSTLHGALELARDAADAGAGALLVMPPYFFRYSQEDVREFLLRFADQAPAGLPILLYNIPAFTNEISGDSLRELLSSGRFAGLKDSSGSFDQFLRLKSLRSNYPFVLIVGDDRIFTEARAQGADGVMSGVSGALPELVVGIEHAILAGTARRAQSLDRRLREFIAWLDRFPAPLGLKLALAARGLPVGPDTVPLGPTSRRLLEQFRGWLRDWMPVVLREAAELSGELARKPA